VTPTSPSIEDGSADAAARNLHRHSETTQVRMLEREITITNRLGLHARASAKLVQALHGFQAATVIAYRGKEINAKSIMGVMMLAAGVGAKIHLRTDGPDEEAAMAVMVDLFERKFDEGQ
jgi:phosphocarrier protein